MSDDKRDVLEVLKFELQFLEQGGYGRSVRTPWKATSMFQDSPSCINFNDWAVLIPVVSVCSPTLFPAKRAKNPSRAISFRSTSMGRPSTAWNVTPINPKWKKL